MEVVSEGEEVVNSLADAVGSAPCTGDANSAEHASQLDHNDEPGDSGSLEENASNRGEELAGGKRPREDSQSAQQTEQNGDYTEKGQASDQNEEEKEESLRGKRARVAEYPVADARERSGEQILGLPTGKAITLNEIQQDKLTRIALENWSVTLKDATRPQFSPELVDEIYRKELLVTVGNKTVPLQRVMVLEISQYLENYLWPNFDPHSSTFEHLMSIILMVNEKFRENVPAWKCFHDRKENFEPFLKRILTLKDESLEDEMVRGPVLRLVTLQLWHYLSPGRLQMELSLHEELIDHWKKLMKRETRAAKKGDGYVNAKERLDVKFIPLLLHEFVDTLDSVVVHNAKANLMDGDSEEVDAAEIPVLANALLYCERFVEFLIDLLSQLPTRRFTRALIEDFAIVSKCRLSALYSHTRGRLFAQLVDLLRFYEGFEIDDQTGSHLSDDDVLLAHCSKLQAFQLLCFKRVPKLKDLSLTNIGALEKRADLSKRLSVLLPEELRDLVCNKLNILSSSDPWSHKTEFLMEIMVSTFEKRLSQREAINALPLYPNEQVMWDESFVPSINYTGEGCLALPKLNLQFLTLHDYLLRNFNLFRLESTYEIREDVHDILQRMGAYVNGEGGTSFRGWARMAVPIKEFKITEVKRPNIGEVKPSACIAEVTFSIQKYKGPMRSEWDELKEHDVLFLLSIQPPLEQLSNAESLELSVLERFGLQYVRGCEVIEMRDEEGHLMNDFTGRVKREDWKPPQGELRTAVVALDTAQYHMDVSSMGDKDEDIYSTFHVLMRRKPKENNFKAILESIRDLMNEDYIVPGWLRDIILGYGDPGAAHWKNMKNQLKVIDFKDTFLDAQHLRDSFEGFDVVFQNADESNNQNPPPPYRVTFPKSFMTNPKMSGSKRKGLIPDATIESSNDAHDKIYAEAYVPPDPGPYPQDKPKQNTVRFTPVQVLPI
ncbi:hypothetical protein KP509_04G109200 [Ceratopteris richardii]|uniref:Intron-binding protein aquarius n=1 Tax=Ceratopteris richardii TaxID=49495 RepID=A0A8T2UWC7_CERRI|nr:hypothetical protein KP509_04G109200 [Ceratopteris richardii]